MASRCTRRWGAVGPPRSLSGARSPVARRTRQQALATRQGILDAAVQVFMERGFQRSSMQHVADRAGVTRGAVYWHFRSQLELLEALLDQTPLPWQVLKPLPEHLGVGTSALLRRQALTRMAAAPLVWLEGSVPAQRLMHIVGQVEAPDSATRLGARLAAVRHAGLQRLHIALVQAAANSEPRPHSAAQGAGGCGACGQAPPPRWVRTDTADPVVVSAAALGVFALVDGLMHHWLRQPAAFGLAEAGTQAVQSLLAGLLET